MYLYFEKHIYYTDNNRVIFKNIKLLEKCNQLLSWQGYQIIPSDEWIVDTMINKFWIDINKYTNYGNNIPEVNDIIKPYVRLIKIKKIKDRNYEIKGK